MTDLEIMQRAKMYLDKLANGINPLDDTTLSDGDIVNNVRISRCLFYVSNVLRQVIENGGTAPKKHTPKIDFEISFEDIQKFPFSDFPITVSVIAKRINEIVDNENMKRLTYKNITDWLISTDMLRVETKPDGKTTKVPTAAGNQIGITTTIRNNARGEYTAVVYDAKAQRFIIDNIESVIALIRSKNETEDAVIKYDE